MKHVPEGKSANQRSKIAAAIICPDDLIATVTALTLAVRVIGGSIGYCV
jgi:hypothetical protein